MASLFCSSTSSHVSPHPVQSLSIDNDRATLPPNKAIKVGAEAPTNEEAKGMDVNIPNVKEE